MGEIQVDEIFKNGVNYSGLPDNGIRTEPLEILIGRVIRKDPDEAAGRINKFLNKNGIGALNELARKSQFALFLKATLDSNYFGNIAIEAEMRAYKEETAEESRNEAINKIARMFPQILANYEGVERFQKTHTALQIWMGIEAAISIVTYLDEVGDLLATIGLFSERQIHDKLDAQKRLLLAYDNELYKFHDGGDRALRWIDRFGYMISKPIHMAFMIKNRVINSEREYDEIPFLSLASSFDILLQRIHEEG
ncbi:MAG: hypothetical protein KGH54_01910 [Candidatus Micrarchaeota archaeon]|nr:hypothetical protein [Candidatus Micrarchaeota archaeon]